MIGFPGSDYRTVWKSSRLWANLGSVNSCAISKNLLFKVPVATGLVVEIDIIDGFEAAGFREII